MLYFAISPSAINPHCGARLALRPRLPSPGGNTIRCRGHFIQCHCLSTAVIRKKRRSRPSGENSGLVGNIKKQGQERQRRGGEDGGRVDTKTTKKRSGGVKNPPELLIGGGASEASDGRQH